ncbi:MAG: GNAT family N-acetyltransferase, partial [Leptothrix sp. (in: b-proteobacteria)]
RSATPRPRLPRLAGVGQAAVPICSFRQRTDAGEAMGAPTIFWRDFASWDDYLQLLRSRKVLSEDQRRGRRLQQIAGPLSFQLDDHADDVLPTCCAWKSARDLSLGRSDLFAQPANRRFFVELRARGLLRASTLRADGKLMAIWLGAVYERRWTGWVFTFNPEPELGRCSPGRQLLYPMLEASHRAGHAEFDFSIGMEPYKLNFATHVRPIGRIGPPPASELAAAQLRRWLRHNPWCHDKAKALRHWLSQAPLAHPFR